MGIFWAPTLALSNLPGESTAFVRILKKVCAKKERAEAAMDFRRAQHILTELLSSGPMRRWKSQGTLEEEIRLRVVGLQSECSK